MTEAKTVPQPIVVLYGRSAIGKPRAGLFRNADATVAVKAAGKLGLSVVQLTDAAGLTLASKIPAGRLGAQGNKIIPFVAKDVFEQIQALSSNKGQSRSEATAPATSSAAESRRLPLNWDDIKIGDTVLAQDSDPADGWWQATVVERQGDVFKLRWPRSQRGRLFSRHRLALALICPGEGKQGPLTEPKKGAVAINPMYPRTWSGIATGQIVLAKEDGPAEQWWEAKIVGNDKDIFTLQWRDHPKLPQIVRPRAALGLVHPNPKAR
jgi:hypothetical protein